MPHSPWFAQFVKKTYFATIGQKTPTSKNSPVEVQNGPFDLFGPVCGKEVIRRIWSGRLRTTTTTCSGFRMAYTTWLAQFMRKTISPHLGSKTAKRPKSLVYVQNAPFYLICPVCEKELLRRIWPARLQKAQKAVFRCRMAHSSWFA